MKVREHVEELKAFEKAYNQAMMAATKSAGNIAAVQGAIQKVREDGLTRYRATYLEENVALVNALLTRRRLGPPKSTADGITVEGFATICSGDLRGDRPLSDLSDYMLALAGV